MKSLFILLAFSAIIISSCTTAYKTGQTPDDVYYSPERPQNEYVQVEDDEDDRSYRTDEQYYEDRQLRMKVRNRTRWSELDDWHYYNNRYSYYGNYNPVTWNNPWSNYSYWNHYYNPYAPKGYVIVNPRGSYTPTYNKPRTFNLNTYIPSTGNSNSNRKVRSVDYSNRNSNNSYNTNSRRDAGSTLRDIFKGSGNNNSSSNNTPSSSTNSGSSNSSSSGSSGSSAPVRKF